MPQPKIALLVGASGGVGVKLALDLAKAGFHLALHYKSGENSIQSLVEEVNALTSCIAVEADITKEAEVLQMVQQVEQALGPIDVLINNAGITRSGMTWKLSGADWEDTLAVNLTGPFYTSKAVLPGMRSRTWGRIINITSVVAQTAVPGTSAYAASKAGLIAMTRTIAAEVATKGITVNCLALGYFDAGMLYEIPEELRENIRNTIPQKSFGDISTISDTILHLCSDSASYMTGQTLNLNGGLHS